MGVMSCSRKDCSNVMCDTYVYNIGYICSECKSEFKEYLQQEGLNPTTEGSITKELAVFIDTSKNSYTEGCEKSVDDFFNERTTN